MGRCRCRRVCRAVGGDGRRNVVLVRIHHERWHRLEVRRHRLRRVHGHGGIGVAGIGNVCIRQPAREDVSGVGRRGDGDRKGRGIGPARGRSHRAFRRVVGARRQHIPGGIHRQWRCTRRRGIESRATDAQRVRPHIKHGRAVYWGSASAAGRCGVGTCTWRRRAAVGGCRVQQRAQ